MKKKKVLAPVKFNLYHKNKLYVLDEGKIERKCPVWTSLNYLPFE